VLHRFTLGYFSARLVFDHHLPFSNEGFAVEPGAVVRVDCMRATDALAPPLVAALGCVLTVPMVHAYAVLWRLGVVEVRQNDRASTRSIRSSAQLLLAPMPGYQPQTA
jgi:hypothetical protein